MTLDEVTDSYRTNPRFQRVDFSRNLRMTATSLIMGSLAACVAVKSRDASPSGEKPIKTKNPVTRKVETEPTPLRYKGPDRVNLTSGRHVGGENKDIYGIIAHITDSEGKSAENWFHHPNPPPGAAVSAHYIIEKDGTIVQIVPENIIAYHCRGKNKGTIGIEFVGKLDSTDKVSLTKKQISKGISLICHLQRKYGISDENVYGHRDFSNKECPGKTNLALIKSEIGKYSPK